MSGKIFLEARWEKLVMVSYRVDPGVLEPFLPAGTALDSHEGDHYVSLVAFLFDKTKVWGIPAPFYGSFPEVNLRFYVTCRRNGETRRGVVFIREIVPGRLVTWMANTFYGEHYETVPIRHFAGKVRNNDLLTWYSWNYRSGNYHVSVNATNNQVKARPESLENFITEHYWGYTRQDGNTTGEYKVEHPGWDLYPVSSYELSCDFGKLYGKPFAHLTGQEPDSVLLAEGSPVKVYFPVKI